ncbi:MAG TPA: ATP-binding cassette domain-containing protein [Caulobacteraceae bacterium]|nr:ATP-binding cassette domain-containing protein [Caulobacteraceae bacterium]
MSAGLVCRLTGHRGALDLDIALSAPSAGVTALTGPSGSGKTTLLRAIAGLERLSGEVRLGAETWQDGRAFTPAHRRPVGFVFQHAGLLAHLTVRDNLRYAAHRAGTGPDAIGWDQAVGLLGLAPLLDRSTAKLSGGERQRVALARALLTRPRLLLLDEPLASLDAAAKAEILPFLERAFAALAIPVLYVSHDRAEVARLAAHAVVLRQGRLVEAAPDSLTPEERLALLSAEEKDALALAALKAGLG